MSKIEKDCATSRRRALRRGDPLPRRPVPPVQVPPLPGRAAGLRPRVRHRLLRRRPGQLQLPPLRPRRRASCASTRTASRRRRPTTSSGRKAGREGGRARRSSPATPAAPSAAADRRAARVPARRGPARDALRDAPSCAACSPSSSRRPRAEAASPATAVRRRERAQGLHGPARRRCADQEFFARQGRRRSRRCAQKVERQPRAARSSTAARGTASPGAQAQLAPAASEYRMLERGRRASTRSCSASPARWCAPPRSCPSPTPSGCASTPTRSCPRCKQGLVQRGADLRRARDRRRLTFSLTKLREELGADHPFVKTGARQGVARDAGARGSCKGTQARATSKAREALLTAARRRSTPRRTR